MALMEQAGCGGRRSRIGLYHVCDDLPLHLSDRVAQAGHEVLVVDRHIAGVPVPAEHVALEPARTEPMPRVTGAVGLLVRDEAPPQQIACGDANLPMRPVDVE